VQVFENSLELSPGESALYINGLRTDLEMDDVFQVLDVLRSEAFLMEGLHSLGIKVQHPLRGGQGDRGVAGVQAVFLHIAKA